MANTWDERIANARNFDQVIRNAHQRDAEQTQIEIDEAEAEQNAQREKDLEAVRQLFGTRSEDD